MIDVVVVVVVIYRAQAIIDTGNDIDTIVIK